MELAKDKIITRTKKYLVCWIQDNSLMTFKDNKRKRITFIDPENGVKLTERYKLIDVFNDVAYSQDASGLRVYCPVKLARITARGNEFDAYENTGTLARC